MNNLSETAEQDLFVTYSEEPREDSDEALERTRPLLSGDAEIFSKSPNAAYIIREWMPVDDRNGFEMANLSDMWGIVIVFPNGFHVHCWYAIPLYGESPKLLPCFRAMKLAKAVLNNYSELAAFRSRSGFYVAESVRHYGLKSDPRRLESARRGRRQGAH
ncbi:hypothetical protein FV228_04350 [Methylobacterium sp. WL18]|uniref:hypothetical protein n=1 Tax=Methylobacterium sp. WL18 TaxID=2603897 RepID=UPI0011CBFB35|nr:hypothetical protein [Methylobacterium sp. WL18]TXN75095.1 hypothetical protein FV228_04350 [Methylobacterium sp. WL18]